MVRGASWAIAKLLPCLRGTTSYATQNALAQLRNPIRAPGSVVFVRHSGSDRSSKVPTSGMGQSRSSDGAPMTSGPP